MQVKVERKAPKVKLGPFPGQNATFLAMGAAEGTLPFPEFKPAIGNMPEAALKGPQKKFMSTCGSNGGGQGQEVTVWGSKVKW